MAGDGHGSSQWPWRQGPALGRNVGIRVAVGGHRGSDVPRSDLQPRLALPRRRVRARGSRSGSCRTGSCAESCLRHSGLVRAIAISPDGSSIAAAEETTISIWKFPQGAAYRVIRGHTQLILSLAFSPDGQRLVSGGQDGEAKIWDLTVDPDLGAVVDLDRRNTDAIAYAEGGRQILTFDREGRIARSQSESQASIETIGTGVRVGWITPAEPACFDAEGRRLVAVNGGDRREAVCLNVAAAKGGSSSADTPCQFAGQRWPVTATARPRQRWPGPPKPVCAAR